MNTALPGSNTRSLITVAVAHDTPVTNDELVAAFERFPGTSVINTARTTARFEDVPWNRKETRLEAAQVGPLLDPDEDGFITVIMDVDQNEFFRAIAGEEFYEFLHNRIFDFGFPINVYFEIIGVHERSFIVSYSLHIASQLGGEEL